MQVSRNLATPSLRAWRKRVVSSRRSPTFAEVLAIYAKCAKPISPEVTAVTLLSNPSSCFAGAQTGGNRAAGHVASGLDAGEGTYEALSVVLVGLGEPGRDQRPVQLVLVHLDPPTDEIVDHLGAGLERNYPLPTYHASQLYEHPFVGQVNSRTN